MLEIEALANYQSNMINKHPFIKKYIDENNKDGLGINTIRRLWCAEKYSKSFSIAILNILAETARHTDWNNYTQLAIKDSPELAEGDNNCVLNDSIDDVEKKLEVGKEYLLGWPPERYAKVKYLGDCKFEVLKYKGRCRDLIGKYFTARWFEVELTESEKHLKGLKEEMYSDIVAVLGDLRKRLYL